MPDSKTLYTALHCHRLPNHDPCQSPSALAHAIPHASRLRYAATDGPALAGVSPATGSAGTPINVTGTNLSGAALLRFTQQPWITGSSLSTAAVSSARLGSQLASGACTVSAAAGGWAACASAPALPAGVYQLVLEMSGGERAADGLQVSRLRPTTHGGVGRVAGMGQR
jgi:hypothetical protein